MSQRNIPESSILEQDDKSDDKSERNWVIKWNTVTHHGKNRIKWKDDLIQWLDLMRSGILPQGCVSHSESIAKLGWEVSEMSVKSSEGWNLMWGSMMLHNQSWCSTSFSTPASPLHLASPFPVTNNTSFRTNEWVQKDVPTRVISNSLLGQAVITHLEGLSG